MLTAVEAFVSISLRCSCKRTNVIIKPRMQSNSDELVRARKGELCLIRAFALQIVKGQRGLLRRKRLSQKKCEGLKETVSKDPTEVAIELTRDIICFKSSAVSETCLRQGDV
jgi:hypothetical protein